MINIIIPTLNRAQAEAVGAAALANAGCEARLIISDGPKRGFTKTVNDGIRQTESGDVCILNDDVSGFPYGWLAVLEKGLYAKKNYGIAGPSGKSATAPASKGKPGMDGLETCRQLAFWCVLIRREVLDKIGLLDERFIHYRSDNEYCHRVRKRGWACVWVRGVFLAHKHKGSGHQREYLKND
ncbi:MAG: hypothetical protein R6V11_05605, partial [Ectothiorhodospiraceae bacterium]